MYNELHRYGLHKNLKTSAGTIAPEKTYYRPAREQVVEVADEELNVTVEDVAVKFFEIDGMTSRELMPYPHDPFREPARWKTYDHLTVRQRLDQMDMPNSQKDLFETMTNSFGSDSGSVIGFTEALRWYALAGHSMARVFEMAGTYKTGKGGMTSLARSILADFRGDILFNAVVKEIKQRGYEVAIRTDKSHRITAKGVISTIPL